jgi:hypothetical protein
MSFWTFSAFFLVLSIKTSLSFLYHLIPRSLECRKSRKRKIGIIIIMLAIVHEIKASNGGRPDAIARGIPPLSSIKGIMLKIIANIGSMIKNRNKIIKSY